MSLPFCTFVINYLDLSSTVDIYSRLNYQGIPIVKEIFYPDFLSMISLSLPTLCWSLS